LFRSKPDILEFLYNAGYPRPSLATTSAPAKPVKKQNIREFAWERKKPETASPTKAS